jgi:hypothetical protein
MFVSRTGVAIMAAPAFDRTSGELTGVGATPERGRVAWVLACLGKAAGQGAGRRHPSARTPVAADGD